MWRLCSKCALLCCLRFQALYNYTPRNEDELELRESDVIDVMEKCDDGWFVGMCILFFYREICLSLFTCMFCCDSQLIFEFMMSLNSYAQCNPKAIVSLVDFQIYSLVYMWFYASFISNSTKKRKLEIVPTREDWDSTTNNNENVPRMRNIVPYAWEMLVVSSENLIWEGVN